MVFEFEAAWMVLHLLFAILAGFGVAYLYERRPAISIVLATVWSGYFVALILKAVLVIF